MNIIPRVLFGLGLSWAAWAAPANELGATEWSSFGNHECMVIPALATSTAWEFHAAFSRHWCLQGWSATSQLLLRESRAEKWMTRIDILRNDELLLTIPMSPWVEQNLEKATAGVVGQLAAYLMQADRNAGNVAGAAAGNGADKSGPPIPGAKQPGSERK